MGYTHYWTWKDGQQPKLSRYAQMMLRDVIRYAKNHGVLLDIDKLHGGIVLNGVDDEAYETFILPGEPGFNFCKTEQKPYDVVVTACLIILNHYHGKEVEVSSDGNAEDWQAGLKLVQTLTTKPARFKIPPKVVSK